MKIVLFVLLSFSILSCSSNSGESSKSPTAGTPQQPPPSQPPTPQNTPGVAPVAPTDITSSSGPLVAKAFNRRNGNFETLQIPHLFAQIENGQYGEKYLTVILYAHAVNNNLCIDSREVFGAGIQQKFETYLNLKIGEPQWAGQTGLFYLDYEKNSRFVNGVLLLQTDFQGFTYVQEINATDVVVQFHQVQSGATNTEPPAAELNGRVRIKLCP